MGRNARCRLRDGCVNRDSERRAGRAGRPAGRILPFFLRGRRHLLACSTAGVPRRVCLGVCGVALRVGFDEARELALLLQLSPWPTSLPAEEHSMAGTADCWM